MVEKNDYNIWKVEKNLQQRIMVQDGECQKVIYW